MTIYYFGFKNSTKPTDIPVLDVRDITNPPKQLRLSTHPEFEADIEFFILSQPIALDLLCAIVSRHRLCGDIAVGCSYGKHRSKIMATIAAKFADTIAKPLWERPNAP
jgi:RNase adaptor protein for sRNA GlmZ degradation